MVSRTKATYFLLAALLAVTALVAQGQVPDPFLEGLVDMVCRMCGINVFSLACCIRRSMCCHYSGRTFGYLEDKVNQIGKEAGILPLPDHLR